MPHPSTHYLAPPAATPIPAGGTDATSEFAQKLNDPSRWIRKTGVPIFKAHERTDPATGQLIKVDLPKLYRIAANMQRLEREGGVPIRMTLGHTEPGKPEVQQPPIGGYYRNARVQPFGPKGEPAVVVDEWLDPQYQPVRKNFPYRSAEYYDDAEQITGVALLTRDPYLDLGVVAYDRGSDPLRCRIDEFGPKPPTQYAWNGRQPTMYRLVLGEPMIPQPQPQPQASDPAMAVPPQADPTLYGQTNYNPALLAGMMAGQAMGQRGQQYSAPWPGPAHQRANIGHNHPSGGAVYSGTPNGQGGGMLGFDTPLGGAHLFGRQQQQSGPRRYADEGPPPPPGGPGDAPPGAGGPPGDPLQQLQMLLMAAVEVLGQVTGGGPAGPGGAPPGAGGPQAPQSPFPPEQEGRDGQYSRYGAPGASRGYPSRSGGGSRRPGRYSDEAQPVNYGNTPRPVPYGAPVQRTISGQPVGYAMQLSQLQYKLAQQEHVLKMLAYERDAADTQACVAEIQRLADMGFPVSEYEVGELKAKGRDQRGAYIQHIMTHYQRVGTDMPPPLLGDPTPAPAPDQNRPASKEEMEAALKLSDRSGGRLDYNTALQQVRYGAPEAAGQVNRIAGYAGGPVAVDPSQAEWAPGQQFDLSNPYGEPSTNGRY